MRQSPIRCVHWTKRFINTRMHSSRMRTARSSSRLGGGGVSTRPLLWPSGVVAFCYGLLAPPQKTIVEGCLQSEGHNRRPHPPGADPPDQAPPWRPARHAGIPPAMHAGIVPPLPPLSESQMPVKTLPCPNFVAGGNEINERSQITSL